MANIFLFRLFTPGLALFFTSCKTYYIPVDSFKQQFTGFDNIKMREVTTQGPYGLKAKYLTYPIDSIDAVDKSNNHVTLPNSPSIELRITDTSNKKTVFYLDLIQFDGENIIGGQSRFIPSLKKTIPINSVRKIEVQEGRKKYKYVNKD